MSAIKQLDAAWLAREPMSPSEGAPTKSSSLRWSPAVAATPQGATVDVVGSF
jgi:hypothetical protein